MQSKPRPSLIAWLAIVFLVGSGAVHSGMAQEPARETISAPHAAQNALNAPAEESPVPLPPIGPEKLAQPTLEFAGGAVKLSIPWNWEASEIAQGRKIRLALAPERVDNLKRLGYGVEIAYYYSPLSEDAPQSNEARPGEKSEFEKLNLQQQLQKLLQQQSLADSSQGASQFRVGAAIPFQISGLNAVRQRVEISENLSQGTTSKREEITLLARCGEALFEMHVIAPVDAEPAAHEIAEQILGSLSISATKDPAGSEGALAPEILDAKVVLGSWKALRASFAFRRDGRVRLRFDREKTWLLGNGRPLDSPPRIRQITGTFQAHGDLLTIVWDDGSRLNYRWRLGNGQLYFTDHLGRVSQLHRLYQ